MKTDDLILLCGDPRGQFRQILKVADVKRASAVILLGEIEVARPLHEELDSIAGKLWFIHAQRDFRKKYLGVFKDAAP
ncbi:MAG: hypothetical protein PSV40_01995 [Polaromonas sp.]|uniref:hypothetical protein n=1 Tax=Polaromonas sp. TaxID=1869339 RepID=UPI002488F701|nr:hypothetical protein [Polaromonas sp.]MDI1267860.1 hypothetical protein [Polaromonas sp.]